MSVTGQIGFLDQIENLPSLPPIVHRILSVTASVDSSADDVARVLRSDQAVAAKILRVANSSFYGAGRQVTQISRAVVMLGTVGVRNLVLGLSARDAFSSAAAQVPEHAALWRHSIAVASASELVARQVGFKPSEEAFIAGLLHDIGQLAMVTFEPEAFRAVFREQGHGTRFLAIERAHFGADHTQAGFQILRRWGLPEAICQVVLRHHEQELNAADPLARLLAVVMLADTFAQMMGFGFDLAAGKLGRTEVAAELLQLTDADQLRILDGLNRRIEQAVEMFASVDMAPQQPTPAPGKRVVWVSAEPTKRCRIGQMLLEHQGYEVTQVSPGDRGVGLAPDDLVVVGLSEEHAEREAILQALLHRGHRRIVILSDPREDETLRRRDGETGVCHIPWLFTAFDLNWVEQQLQSV